MSAQPLVTITDAPPRKSSFYDCNDSNLASITILHGHTNAPSPAQHTGTVDLHDRARLAPPAYAQPSATCAPGVLRNEARGALQDTHMWVGSPPTATALRVLSKSAYEATAGPDANRVGPVAVRYRLRDIVAASMFQIARSAPRCIQARCRNTHTDALCRCRTSAAPSHTHDHVNAAPRCSSLHQRINEALQAPRSAEATYSIEP